MLAATLCVNSAGSAGCYAKIGAAVSAAGANDTINIGAGTYSEGVVLNKPLALIGAGSGATIINAKGQPNGIYVDGLDNPGMTGLLITGLAVMNANFEGILVTNASYLVISEIMLPATTKAWRSAREVARACRCLKPTKDKTAAKESI